MLTEDDKRWFTGQLEILRTEFAEKLEKVETTMLTEFHKWALPVELRQKSHAAALRAHDAEPGVSVGSRQEPRRPLS